MWTKAGKSSGWDTAPNCLLSRGFWKYNPNSTLRSAYDEGIIKTLNPSMRAVFHKGKGKGSPWHLVQSCLTLGCGAHPRFQAIEPAFVRSQQTRHGMPLLSHRGDTYLSTCIFYMLPNCLVGRSWDKQRELTPSCGFNLMTAGLLTLQHRGFCGLTPHPYTFTDIYIFK